MDTTYVDAECIMLAASTPAALDRHIDILLDEISAVFRAFGLTINWSKGKTEAILLYRGRDARIHWRLRQTPDGPVIAGPDGLKLHVVTSYKHVGSTVVGTANYTVEARARAKSALSTWCKLAVRVFGSKRLSQTIKLQLADSLVFSRLFFATETWDTERVAPLRVLEAVQTRVARRIAGTWNYDPETGKAAAADDRVSNEEVRRRLDMPSVQCELRQRRLLYLARVLRSAPASLRALLQTSPGGHTLPWVSLVMADMRALRLHHAAKLEEMPDPETDARPWCTVMMSYPTEWNELVRSYRYYSSTLLVERRRPHFIDASQETAPSGADPATRHCCSQCPLTRQRVFADARALNSHLARVHGVRRAARRFVSSGVCPACGLDFVTRARAIYHLQISSKQCRARMDAGELQQISPDIAAAIDKLDTAAAKASRREGHPTPLATAPGPRRGPKPLLRQQ
jgi:hypothetical protein